MARFLSLIFATVLLLTGCGYELFMTVQRLGSTKDIMTVLPSWPIELKLGLGGASMPVSSLIPTSSNGITILADGSYAFVPAAQTIPTIKLGDNLKVPAQAPIAIPTQSIPVDPPSHQDMASQSITVQSMGLMDATIPVVNNNTHALDYKTIAQIVATDSYGTDPVIPTIPPTPGGSAFTYPFTKDESQAVTIPNLRGAKLAAGSKITLNIVNDIGGTDATMLNLRLSNVKVTTTRVTNSTLVPYDLNRTWRNSHASVPLTTGTVTIDLDEDTVITGAITVSFTVGGQITSGFHLKQLSSTQAIQIGVGADVFLKAVSIDAQEIPTSTQSIDLPTASLAEAGIGSLSNIKIATGSVTMQVSNGFGFNVNLNLVLKGVKDSRGDEFVYPGFLPAGTANAPTVTNLVIPLSGATITGTHIDVTFTGYTFDTETRFPTIPRANELPDGMAVFDSNQKLSGSVTVNELEFESISATLARTVPLASSSTPFPADMDKFTKYKVGLGRIGLQIQLDNKSQFQGQLTLNAKVKLPGGAWLPLQYNGNMIMAPASVPGETKVNLIDINETNSNLIDLLNAGGSEIAYDATFAINSGATPIQLTRSDQIGGKLAASLPLSLIFKEMGVGKEVPPYDITPASELPLDGIKDKLEQGIVSKFALILKIDNGLHIPLDLNLLLSQTPDPFTDPAPLVKTISLGNGRMTQVSEFGLTADEMTFLKDCKKMGFRVSSPGTHGKAVSLFSTDQLRIAVLAELKARISAKDVSSMGGK